MFITRSIGSRFFGNSVNVPFTSAIRADWAYASPVRMPVTAPAKRRPSSES